ncbi:MAG: hypothetical protein WD079_06775 [Phycisphaeraceae bacterium]
MVIGSGSEEAYCGSGLMMTRHYQQQPGTSNAAFTGKLWSGYNAGFRYARQVVLL